MAFRLVDRVRETAISPGTGTAVLTGAALGYQTFSAGVGANNTTYYVIADQSGANWEVGYGTVGALGTTLARTTVLSSSNAGALVNFSSGTQDVWVDYPATRAVNLDSSGKLSFGGNGTGYADWASAAPTVAAGRMWYNGTDGSWNLGMGGGNITQQIGEELFYYGKASAAITDSPLQIIKQTGVVGASGVITFAPTTSGITDGSLIVGVATESLALNAFGRITTFGVIHGVTTDGSAYGETWADGDVIWYNPVTGNPTKIKPVAPNIKVQIGTVINAGSGGSGSFSVEINHGSVLGGTDSNVQLTSATGGQILTYNQTGQYWANVSLGAGTGFSATAGVGGSLSIGASVAAIGTWMGTPSSANLLAAMTDETGIGLLVFNNTPTFISPLLGTPTSGNLSNCTNIPAGQLTGTIPSGVLGNSTLYVGTTAIDLNRASANLALTGLLSGTFQGSTSGSVQLIPAAAAGTGTVLTMPATTGTIITSGDSATVTNTMLAGSIANAKLLNSSVTFNGVSVALGASGTITAANPNALTISSPLSGTSYNGSSAVTIALAAGYGDTQNPFASKTAKYFLAAPNGTAGDPTFRAIVAADIPTLNQNTTGSAATLTTGRTIGMTGDVTWTSGSFNGSANVTGTATLATVTVAKGGTGLTTTPANGALDIGNGTGFTRTTLTAGAGISITNGTGTITIANTAPNIVASYLVVGGGGGAGSAFGGGGGAGGLLSGTVTLASSTTYTVTVGAGGAGANGSIGIQGSSSQFGTLTASIGGGGGGAGGAGGSGGSGGGAGSYGGAPTFTAASGTSGQGNAGGQNTGSANYGTGGGGGAGAVGGTGTTTVNGDGGVGVASSITGSSVTYAGGGGAAGGLGFIALAGAGGAGGGGAGGSVGTSWIGVSGTANTGGGGGAGAYSGSAWQTGGAGGSGVVILSIPTSLYTGTTTGSPTVTTSGSNTIMKFTASGSYTA